MHIISSELSRWWSADPTILRQYPRFRNKSIEEIKAMPRLRSHGSHVFLELEGLIHNIENDAVMEQLLLDMKRDHFKTRHDTSIKDYEVCC